MTHSELLPEGFAAFGRDEEGESWLMPRGLMSGDEFVDDDLLPDIAPGNLPKAVRPNISAGEVIAGMDLGGMTAMVTGGYSGIGLAITQALCSAGAHVWVPAKDMEKAENALAPLGAGVTIEPADFRNRRQIHAFADRFLKKHQSLDILINQAGVLERFDRLRLADGYGVHFWVNYLSHYLLTNLLVDALKKARKPRVVNGSSAGHLLEKIRWGNLNCKRMFYDPDKEDRHSKTAMTLFTVELAHRLYQINNKARVFSAHPGVVQTGLLANQRRWIERGLLTEEGAPVASLRQYFKRRTEVAAATAVYCATNPELDDLLFNGHYFEDCRPARLLDEETQEWRGVAPHAQFYSEARLLWSVSKAMLQGQIPP